MARRLVLVSVFVVSCLPYLGGLNYPLLHDDFPAVLNNPLVRKGFYPVKIFSTNAWGGRKQYGMLYRPLWVLGVSFTYNFISDKIWVHRLENILLHALAAMLITLILLRLRVPIAAAGLAGLLFGVQAVHTEAIMFVVNRQEIQAALFILLAVYMALRKTDLSIQALLYVLALFSKESAVVFPLIYLLILWGVHRAKPRKLLIHGLVLAAITVIYLVIRRYAIGYWTSGRVPFLDNPLVNSGPYERVLSVFGLYWQALSMLILPSGLTIDYGFNVWPEVDSMVDPRFIAGFTLAVLTVVFIYYGLRNKRDFHVSALFFLVFLVSYALFSNALKLNTILFAERNLYLPSAFFLIALFTVPAKKMTLWIGGGIAMFLILANLAITMDRVPDYRNPIRLYASSLAARPNSPRLETDLALGFIMMKQNGLAMKHLLRAIHIYPLIPEPYNIIGNLYYKAGKFRDAIPWFLKGVAVGPGNLALNYHLCSSYKKLGYPKQADIYCRRVEFIKQRLRF